MSDIEGEEWTCPTCGCEWLYYVEDPPACPKCHSEDLACFYSTGRTDCSLTRRGIVQSGGPSDYPCRDVGDDDEHLEVTCRTCQHAWNEPTADSDKHHRRAGLDALDSIPTPRDEGKA